MNALETTFGGYRLLELLHKGGGGLIYRAIDLQRDRPAAVKAPHHRDTSNVEALRREAAVLRQLQRAGIRGVVELYDEGVHEGLPWYAMELVQGYDLRHLLRTWRHIVHAADTPGGGHAEPELLATTTNIGIDSGLDASENTKLSPSADWEQIRDPGERVHTALRIVQQLAATLHSVHALGILHGDLSPANVMLDAALEPILLDFGTSFARFEPGVHREAGSRWVKGRGTPGYAAPEVLRAETLDSRCDIYSLGCIAFELLFGKPVFSAATINDLVRQHLERSVQLPEAALSTIAPGLTDLLQRMLAKQAAQRTAHAHTVASVVRQQLEGDPTSTEPTTPHVMLFRPRVRGRTEALVQLEQAVSRARNGHGGLALVIATSGLGKTRLLNELAHAAQKQEASIIAARCRQAATVDDAEAQLHDSALRPFVPLVELAINELGVSPNASTRDALDQWAAAALAPYASDILPNVSPPDGLRELPPARATERVFDALVHAFERLSRKQFRLLLLDDLQWADELSLRFLSTRAEQLAKLPVLVVAALRAEADPSKFEALTSKASPQVTLATLDEAEVSEVAKDLLGTDDLPEGFAPFIQRQSEGNPFFVAEYVRAAMARALLWQQSGKWYFRASSSAMADSLGLPASVDEVFATRTERLSEDGKSVLRFAAIVGRDFDADIVRELAGQGIDTDAALQELISHQLLEQQAPEHYRFTHDKLRESQISLLSPQQKQALHREVATALERRATARVARKAPLLGYHWAAANEPERALPHLEAAAKIALAEYDIDAACEFYRLAIAQLEKATKQHHEQHLARLNEALADALVVRALHSAARDSYTRALAHLPPGSHLERARLHRKRAASYCTLHDYENAGTALSQSELELSHLELNTEQDWQQLVEVKLGRFEQLYFSQRREQLDPLVDELVALVDEHGTPRQRLASYLAAASHRMLSRRYAFDEEAVRLTRRALKAAEALPLEQSAIARFNHAFALTCGLPDHCKEALCHFEQATVAANELRATTLLSRITTYAAIATLRLGDVNATAAAAEQARRAAEASRLAPYLAAAKACQGWVHWRRGNDAEARELIHQARQVWRDHPHPFPMRWMTTFALISYAETEDDLAAARLHLAEFSEPSMQALPFQQVIDATAAAFDGKPDARESSRLLRALLRDARHAGYC